MLRKKTAVVLFNLGGPDKTESVKPFLFNLFNDKAIISLPQPFRFLLAKFISGKREKKAQGIYAEIGGKSPLLELTQGQAHALEKELSLDGKFGEFKVFICMRYWHPMAQEVARKVKDYAPDEVVFLPLYPQFSGSTTGSSFEDFEGKLRKECGADLIVKKVCCYPSEPEFIKAHALLLKRKILEKYEGRNLGDFRILFSAHGLPQKFIEQGDPYVDQIEKTTQKVMDNLVAIFDPENKSITRESFDYKVCFQSKVGPLKWTSPSLDHEIKRVAIDGKIPVIVPIAFVSDHSETLVELDIEYREMAEKLGVKEYLRVPALNSDWHFIEGLAKICREVSRANAFLFSGCKSEGICGQKSVMCPFVE